MILRVLVLCLLCGGLAGCVNLKPKADVVKLYALGPGEFSPEAAKAGPPIYVARPDLPAYLDGKRLQYRHADGEVRSLRRARWAEPLQEGVARALAEFLIDSNGLPVSGFYPWPEPSGGELKLRVHLHQIGATAAGEIRMVANWELQNGRVLVASGLYQSEGIEWRPGDAESLVAGINLALSQLAAEVAGAL